jgi:glycosyltransferase involved in cell wall biosynthesis
MNILIVTCILPWPLNSGGHASQYSTLRALSLDHRFRIVLTSYSHFSHEDADQLEANLESVSIVRPKPSQHPELPIAKGSRTSFLLRKIRSLIQRFFVKKSWQSGGSQELVSANEVKRPYFPFEHLSQQTISCIDENIDWADIIQAEFHESLFVGFLPYAHLPKIFVCHQAHSIYTSTFYRDLLVASSPKSALLSVMAEADRLAAHVFECAAMNYFDHIIVFSDKDKQSLLPSCSTQLSVSPFPLPADVPLLKPEKSNFTAAKLVFVGPGYWHPNVDAINWFYHKVLIDLAEIHGISTPVLHVVGRWDVRQTLAYDSSLVCFHGYTEDISTVLTGAITINPVFTGAGLRTKLLAAAASSSPIISTTHGAEGTGLAHGKDCLLADSAECFANSITTLLQDKDLAYQLALNAFNHVSALFSEEAVRASRNNIYESVCSHLQR